MYVRAIFVDCRMSNDLISADDYTSLGEIEK